VAVATPAYGAPPPAAPTAEPRFGAEEIRRP